MVTLEMERGPSPVLLRVMACVELVLPTIWGAKFSEVTGSETVGRTPLPESAMFWPIAASLVTTWREPERTP